MDTKQFLNRITPVNGYKAVWARVHSQAGDVYPWQRFRKTADELDQVIQQLDQGENSVFFALASFKEIKKKGGRKKDNVLNLKSLWLDVDCGEDKALAGKGYRTQHEAVAALILFLKSTHLPQPIIVSSGNGLHLYWSFVKEIPVEAWDKLAAMLKGLTDHFKFLADPSRTTDAASVLRPVGSYHRKNGELKTVTLLKDADDYDVKDLAGVLVQAVKQNNVSLAPVSKKKKKTSAANQGFLAVQEYPPSDAALVADKCAQIKLLRDTKGDIEEPVWYAGLGVISHCIDGKDICHQWSTGYSGYTKDETDQKLAQLDEYNPTTCARFEYLNQRLCNECMYKERITSPIQLGTGGESLPAPSTAPISDIQPPTLDVATRFGIVTVQLPDPPKPFKRTEHGLFVEQEGLPIKFFDHDLHPIKIIRDEHYEYEQVILRYKKPIEGWMEFRVRLAALADNKKFNESMADNGVIIPTSEDKKLMAGYLVNYVKTLQKTVATTKLFANMGWKDGDTKFVIGNHILDSEGGENEVGMSASINPSTAEGFKCKGDLDTWIELTEVLDEPGMEAHAFALLVAFGAPLMHFTGLEALLINLVGITGTGKSTMQAWVNSVYGESNKMEMSKTDTDNAKFTRMSIYSHLPVTIDEITTIDPFELSEFVYRLTQGRDKARLRRDAVEQGRSGEWNTILLSSSNSSLLSKMAIAKANPEAEAMRVFEYVLPNTKNFEDYLGKRIHKVITKNYGHAGRQYIKSLLSVASTLEEEMEKFTDVIEDKLNLAAKERYWTAAIACCLYGGTVAKRLGLIRFDINRIIGWTRSRIDDMRKLVDDNVTAPTDLLAEYLLGNLENRLIVNEPKTNKDRKAPVIIEEMPRRELHIRIERHSQRMFISRPDFRKYVVSRNGEIPVVMSELRASKMLLSERRYYLGRGTDIQTPQVVAMELDMQNPLMSGLLQMVGHNEKPDAMKKLKEVD